MSQATTATFADFASASAPKAQTPHARRPPNTMGKIFLLVAVAIVVFMGFTTYSVHKEIQGSAQLAAIKDLYFPVLQRLDANIVRTDKMEDLFIQVVVAGDKDMIGKATELGSQADSAFAQITKLYPSSAASVVSLRAELKQYQDLATQVSTAFLEQSSEDVAPLTEKMNAALAAERKDLTELRQSSYDEFVQTLASSQRDARVRLLMGLALGVMNLGFMAVLVYFIRNNMNMMAVIAVQNATLEERVAERTAQLSQKTHDINAMLQNMALGVSTVIPGNLIHSEYSKHLRTIFGIDDVAGKDLISGLFDKSSLGVDAKDQINAALSAILGEDEMMFEFNGHLLAHEMGLSAEDGKRKIVHMDWSPIVSDAGVVEKVLLITEDVTHLRELEESSAHQKEELDIIGRIIKVSIGKFNELVESSAKFIAANRRLISDSEGKDAEVISALFRNMHTIKGNARTFEFTHITDVAHQAEQSYDRMRKDPLAAWDSAQMLLELGAVEKAVARYASVNEDKLGRKGRAGDLLTTRGAFVAKEKLVELSAMAAKLVAANASDELAQLCQEIDELGLIPLSRLLSGAVDSLSSLSNELKKPTPVVQLTNGDIAFNSQFAEALKSCLMHIVRNSLDHGIESPAERLAAGKSEQGTLRIACERLDDRMQLHIGDDGRGLALHKLCIAGGMFGPGEAPTREAVAELIFRSGLSTSTAVTLVSGRGVGMDAVRTFLKEQGASIRVELKESGEKLGFTPFEFVIDIPLSACSH